MSYFSGFRLRSVLALPILIVAAAPLLCAGNFSFTGTFAADDSTQLFNFTLSSTANVVLRTYSYGGGTNTAGAVIPAGGFDPVLYLWNSTGTEIASNDDDTPATNPCPHVTFGASGCLDSYYSGSLSAGTYTLGLAVSGNTPNGGPADGFAQAGNPGFTCANFGTTGNFCDSLSGAALNGKWAVDLLSVSSATVPGANTPEPAMWPLTGLGISLLAMAKRGK